MDQDRTRLIRIFVGLAVIIIIAALVWVIFFRGDSADNNDTQETGQTTSQDDKGSDAGSTAAPKPDAAQPTSPDQGTQSNQPAPTGNQLVAVGADNTAVIFTGAVFVGAVGHYLYRRWAYARAIN